MSKRNRIILIIAIVLSVFTVILYFIKNKDKNKNDIEFTSKKQLIAVGYLNSELDLSDKYIDLVDNVKVYDLNGDDFILIIPRYDNVYIDIYGDDGDLLVKDYNLPFVIKCDFNRNYVVIKYKKNEYKYEFDKRDFVFDLTGN